MNLGLFTLMRRQSGQVRLRILVGLGALLLGGGVILMGLSSASDPGPSTDSANDSEWFTVDRRSFDLTVIASGELEAREQVEIKSQVSGSVPIIEIVEEGTFVQEGDFIAKLDDDNLQDKIEEEILKVESARSASIAAEQEEQIAINEAQSADKAAQVKLTLAELDLAKWESGEVKQKRRELELALKKAQRRVKRAAEDLKLSHELYDQKFISLNELDDSIVEELEAGNALETAHLDIKVYEQFAYHRDHQKNQSDVEQARSELERTRHKNESKLAKLRADLESKQRMLKIREDRLDELKTQQINTRIIAPRDGLVVYRTSVGRRYQRQDPIAPGRQIRFNETMVLLPDTRQMVAALRVHEALLPQVDKGQPVVVTVSARPNQPIAAEVLSLAVMAQDGGWLNPQLREYKVRVALPVGIDASLKPGMRCSGEIKVGRVEDALAVPLQAVFSEGSQRFCYVPDGRKVRRQPITIGRASEAMVEVTAGLEPGTQVLLRSPHAGEEAAS